MITKMLEIRDKGTTISALAIQVSGHDGYLMRRAGFGAPMVYLIMLATQHCRYDPWAWNDRTMHTAHLYIQDHFDELENDAVVDCEFILGETSKPKKPERTDGVPA